MKAITLSADYLHSPHRSSIPAPNDHRLAQPEHPSPGDGLDPTSLDDRALASVRSFLAQGESRNTRRSVDSAMRYWSAWFELRYHRPLGFPVQAATVMQFIIDHLERLSDDGSLSHDLPDDVDEQLVKRGVKAARGALALNTVMHRIAILSSAHRERKLPTPTDDSNVYELLESIRRAYAVRGVRPSRKTALTKDLLEAVLNTCGDDLKGIRDRAILLFAFSSGGRRRSEVCEAVMENLQVVGENAYVYRLARSKTDPTGEDHASDAYKPIVGVAASALTKWLAASGITSGPIFRRIRRKTVTNEMLSGDSIHYIVQHRTALAGLVGSFGAHSLRSGFVTEAGRQNISLGEVMAMTGHRCAKTALQYFQAGAMQSNRAAKLIDYR